MNITNDSIKRMKLIMKIEETIEKGSIIRTYPLKRLKAINQYINRVSTIFNEIPVQYQIDLTNEALVKEKYKKAFQARKIKNLFKKYNVKETENIPVTKQSENLLKLVLPIIKNTSINPFKVITNTSSINDIKIKADKFLKEEKVKEEKVKADIRREKLRLWKEQRDLENLKAEQAEKKRRIQQEEQQQQRDIENLIAIQQEEENKIKKEKEDFQTAKEKRIEIVYQALIKLPSSLHSSKRFISSGTNLTVFGEVKDEGRKELTFGVNIEGRKGEYITKNGATASIMELVERDTRDYGRRLFMTKGILGKQRVNIEGTKLYERSIEVTDLNNIVLKNDKYFITNSDGTGEAEIPFLPNFNNWTVIDLPPIVGGSYNGTKLIKTKYRMLKKKLEPMGFYPRKNTRKYLLPKNCIAVDSLDSKYNNDCFYHALQFFYPNHKIPMCVDRIRVKLGITSDEPMNSYHITKIEEMLDIEINIFNEKMDIIYGNSKSQYNILLADNHYFAIIIDATKPKETKIKKPYKKPLLVFFDFESIVNKKGVCRPYSWSLCTMSYDGLTPERTYHYIGEKAMETFDDKLYYIYKALNGRPITLISFNGDKFDNILYSEYLLNPAKKGKRMIQKLYYVNLTHDGTSVTNIEDFKIKGTIDMYKILTGSLKANCKNYQLDIEVSKSSFDHSDAQKAYELGGIDEIKKQYGEKLLKYNDLDVISLRELFKKMLEDIQEIAKNFAIKIPKGILERQRTISSLTKYISNLVGKKNNSKKPGILMLRKPEKESKEECKERVKRSYDLFDKYRPSLIGGRSQMISTIPVTVLDYVSADVVSLYPSVMTDNVIDPTTGKRIDHYYPTGMCYEVDRLIPITIPVNHPLMKYQMGIYVVKNINQSHLKKKLIPSKEKEGLNWNCDLIKERVLTTIDIAHLEKYKCTFEVCEGIVWETYDNTHMGPYVREMYKLKQEQDVYKALKDKKNYNPSKRQQIKMLLNALFGKNCENIHTSFYKIVHRNKVDDCEEELDDKKVFYTNNKAIITGKRKRSYFQKKWNSLSKNHTLAGSFILSYSRYFMFHFINKYNVIYTDTDSLHMHISEYEDMKKNYPWIVIKNNKKEFGQFENEFVDKGVADKNICHYIGKKMYCICDKDNKPVKTSCKGVSIKNVEGFGYYKEDVLKRFTNENVLEFYMILKNKGWCDISTVQWTKKNLLKIGKDDYQMGAVIINTMKKKITSKNYRNYVKLLKYSTLLPYDYRNRYPLL